MNIEKKYYINIVCAPKLFFGVANEKEVSAMELFLKYSRIDYTQQKNAKDNFFRKCSVKRKQLIACHVLTAAIVCRLRNY